MSSTWTVAVIGPFLAFGERLLALLPRIAALVLIVALALVMGWGLRRLIARLLARMGFDSYFARFGIPEPVFGGGVRRPASTLCAGCVYWLVVVFGLLAGIAALDLPASNAVVASIVAYIPQILLAMAILVVGHLAGVFFGQAALIAAVNAHLPYARGARRLVHVTILILAGAMALTQLGIAPAIVLTAFTIAFGGVVLALALAFGLGGRDAARQILERLVREEPPERAESPEDRVFRV